MSRHPLERAKDDMCEQFDISFKGHGLSWHEFIMAGVSPSLLYFESLWKGLHHGDCSKPFSFRGIVKQGEPSVGAQQTGVSLQEHINAKSRSEIDAATEQTLRQCTKRLHT